MTRPAVMRLGVLCVLLFAIVLAGQAALLDIRPGNGADDYVSYVSNARSILTGDPYGTPGYVLNPRYNEADSGQSAYPPGYPLALVPFMAAVADPLRAAGLANCCFYAGFVVLLLLFALPATGLAGAIGIAVVVAASPEFINQGKLWAPSESFYFLILIAALLALRQVQPQRRPGVGSILGAGVLMGLVGLTRVTGVLLAPAAILADVLRTRRIAWPSMLAGCIAALLFVGVVGTLAREYFVQNLGVLTTATAGSAAPGMSLSDMPGVVLENLRQMPGNLTAFWTIRGVDSAPPLVAILRRGGTLLMIALAAVGLVVQVRRGISAAETFFLLQIALLLVLTKILASPRYWLPVSMLALYYAVIGGRLVGGLVLRRMNGAAFGAAAGSLVVPAWALVLAVFGSVTVLATPEPYSVVQAPARQAFDAVRELTPPGAVIVARRPRTVASATKRSAVDYHLTPARPEFWAWADSVNAGYLLLFIDQADVASASQAGRPEAFARYERAMIGPAFDRVAPLFDNGWYRLYGLADLRAGIPER